MQGLEYALWNAVINGEQAYGQNFITAKDCETLRILSEACDSWIYFDESSEETAISLSLWKKWWRLNCKEIFIVCNSC
jgi:hypothetical protein